MVKEQIERKEEEIANCRKKIFWKLDLITWQDFYQIILQIPGCKISAYLIKEYDQSVPMIEIEDHVSKIEFQYCENMELLQRDWKEMEEVSLDEVDAISIANIMYSLEKVNPAIVDQFYQLIYEQKVSKM